MPPRRDLDRLRRVPIRPVPFDGLRANGASKLPFVLSLSKDLSAPLGTIYLKSCIHLVGTCPSTAPARGAPVCPRCFAATLPQAQGERSQQIAVRPEPVEGLVSTHLERSISNPALISSEHALRQHPQGVRRWVPAASQRPFRRLRLRREPVERANGASKLPFVLSLSKDLSAPLGTIYLKSCTHLVGTCPSTSSGRTEPANCRSS